MTAAVFRRQAVRWDSVVLYQLFPAESSIRFSGRCMSPGAAQQNLLSFPLFSSLSSLKLLFNAQTH